MTTDEEKLLAILSQPDLVATMADAAEKVVAEEDEKLTEDQRATLQALLEAGLPTPEQIIRDAKIAEHNDAVRRRREEDLAKRRERRAKLGKTKHRRR